MTTHEYDTDTSTRKSVLKLKKSIVSESGVYTCKWELENGSPTATVNVNIMGKFNIAVFASFTVAYSTDSLS